MKRKLICIIAGGILLGIGVNAFILPLGIMNGGVFGIGLLLHYLFGWKTGLLILCVNTPIYLAALKYHRDYFFNALIGMASAVFFIELLFPIHMFFHLPYIAGAAAGGLFSGTGTGLMLRQKTSPGGIDLLALMISKRTAVNPGLIMAAMDALIISAGLFLLKDIRLLYSLLLIGIAGTIAGLFTSVVSIQFFPGKKS
ncbi:YitT family protein [Metabacillus sp. GX 13764]|uniref:YitT family protein n=1 Tax=Metabacillus kandeliae TaxID=2900151 RepID=UPI001E61E369|nr:YitT family protein [Metabacillus kandeliae]MCD7034791.1 YitT family protein [Metabacillus kandeliae]